MQWRLILNSVECYCLCNVTDCLFEKMWSCFLRLFICIIRYSAHTMDQDLINKSHTFSSFFYTKLSGRVKNGDCLVLPRYLSQMRAHNALSLAWFLHSLHYIAGVLYRNRPFYSCGLSYLAYDCKRGWRWPCFDTDFSAFLM